MMRPKTFARRPYRSATRLCCIAAALSLALTACGGGGSGAPPGKTVKIGVMGAFGQGEQAESAVDQYDGIQLGKKWVEEHGGLFDGSTIEFSQGTEDGKAALAATTARKMVNDGVKLVLGPAFTPDCLSAGPIFDAADAVSIVNCTTSSLTGKDRKVKNLYRWDTNDTTTSTALGLQAAKNYKDVDVVDVVAYDYLQGHEGWDTFRNTLKAKGITNYTTEHEFFVPSGTTNYSSQASVLAQTPNDSKKRILVLLTWGSGFLNFIQQAAPLGVFNRYDAVMTTNMYYKSAVALNGKAPKVWNSYGTCDSSMWKNDQMAWFTQQMQSVNKRLPDDWSTLGFNQMLAMAAAINKARSTDSAKVNEAMSTLSFDSATGTQTMNPDTHQAERGTPVCETVGDPAAPEGVKLLDSSILSASETGTGIK